MAQMKQEYILKAIYEGKGEIKKLNDDLKSLKKIEGFKEIQDSWQRINTEFVAAKAKMRNLKAEMAKPGNSGMAEEYEKSVAAVAKLAAEISKKKTLLDSHREAMKAAGVDVTNLAGEYDKLKQSINGLSTLKAAKSVLGLKSIQDVKAEMVGLVKAYRDISGSAGTSSADQSRALEALRKKTRELYDTIKNPPKLDAARSVLGMTSMQSVVAEINKAKAAYATLASSGKLSMADLARAKVALGQRIDELRSKTNGWRDALSEMRGRAVELGAALAGIVIPSKIAIEFESAMADVRKTVDGTPEQIKALGDELKEMTRSMPLTAVELAKVAAAGGQLGIAAKDIGEFVRITATMATAFNMPAAEAGVAIGKLKNIFSLSLKEIESFGDAINQLGNTTAATEKDIVEVLLRIGGTSKSFGLAKEQAAALAAAMLSLGKSPEVAATGINALLNKMQTATQQSGDFQEALGRIGMSADQMAEAVAKNPQKAITDLLETLAKLDNREKSEVLTGLFGAEYQDDIAVLVNSLQTYRDTLDQVGESSYFAGALTKEFLTRAGTTGNELILLKNVLIEIAGNLGEGFLPAIKKGSEFLREMLQPIASLIGYFPKISAGLVAFGTGAVVFTTVTRLIDIAKMAILSFGGVGVSSLGLVGTAAINVGRALKIAGAGFASFMAGWEVGTWLRQFDVVEKAGIALSAGLTKGWLRAKLAWEEMTLGDVSGATKKLEEADRIYGEMFADVGKKAKETANVQVKAQQQVAVATEGSANKQAQVTKAALDEMKKQYQSYASEVKRLQGEILSEEKSLDQQLRDLARSGMSEESGWKDKEQQAKDYAIIAKAAGEAGKLALQNGNTEGATSMFKTQTEYAKMAKELFTSLGVEVKNGDQVISTQAENLKIAMAGVKSVGEQNIAGLKGMQDAAKAAMDQLTEKSGLKDLSEGMDAAEQKWLKNWQTMRATAIEDIDKVEERLEKMVSKDRTIYVNVKEPESRASGGLIGAQRLAAGGSVTWMGNMLRGGFFPGFGGGDRRLILGEDGEVMIRKESVRAAGLRAALAFNAGRFDIVIAELTKKIRTSAYEVISKNVGGIINRMPTVIGPQYMQAGGSVVGAAPSVNNYNLTLNYTPNNSGPGYSNARDLATTVLKEFQRMHRGRS